MRAPNPRGIDEIVTDILDELKPSRNAREEITAEIRDWISVLRAAGNPTFGYWADNQKHAKKLRDWITQGEALFADMPDSFRLLMFLFLGEWTELLDRTDRKAIGRFRRLLSLLGWLRQHCNLILQIKAGDIHSGEQRTAETWDAPSRARTQLEQLRIRHGVAFNKAIEILLWFLRPSRKVVKYA
jgi:hypothetical protein